jgi:hypothetical protein
MLRLETRLFVLSVSECASDALPNQIKGVTERFLLASVLLLHFQGQ